MPRRIFTYASELNLGGINMIITIGGFVTGIGALVFVWNVIRSLKHGEKAGPNPWDAHTLEWATSSPPPEYNFPELPNVKTREPMWTHADELGALATMEPKHPIQLPSPSYWPIFTAFGVVLSMALMMTSMWWPPLIGAAWVAIGILNWAHEPQFK